MEKAIVGLVLLLFFCFSHTMQEKSLWVKTIDTEPLFVTPEIIGSSNLLIVLSEKCMGSFTRPLIIPPTLLINNEIFELYRLYSTIPAASLHHHLTRDSYFKLIETAAKLKALKIYIDLIAEILPSDQQSMITKIWISHLLIHNMIKREDTSYIFPAKKALTRNTRVPIHITDDGRYLVHDFCSQIDAPQIEIYNTRTKENKSLHPYLENQRIYCSPNNNYLVIVDLFKGIYLYHIPTQKKHFLYKPYNQDSDITISDNSTYILSRQLLPFNDYKIIYNLWSITNDIPQEIDLEDRLWESICAIFHPDSKNIFHINGGKLYVYNIGSKISTQRTLIGSGDPKRQPKQFILYDTLVTSSDKKHIVCKMKNPRNSSLSDLFNYAVLNIENMEEITFTLLPPVHQTHLPPVCIAHKNLVAYCADNMELLQLFNKKGILVASHTKEKHRISALASDKAGNYLACGYSNGSILLVDTLEILKKNCGTRLIGLSLPIKNLTFTDNNLLFAHAKPEIFVPNKHAGYASLWDTQGNYIINFGCSVFDAHISKDGTTIGIIETDIQSKNTSKKLELTCYDLSRPLPTCTLKQAYNLLQENKSLKEK